MAEQLCSAWRGSAGIPGSPARAELANHRPVPHFSLLGLWGVAEAACLPSGLASPGLDSHLVLEAPAPEQGESRQKGGSEQEAALPGCVRCPRTWLTAFHIQPPPRSPFPSKWLFA